MSYRKKPRHFKSKEAYRKYLAFGHMRTKTDGTRLKRKGEPSLFEAAPGHQKIVIAGKRHKVKHKK